MKGRMYNEDCLKTIKRLQNNSVDLVITSPPYNAIRNDSGYKNRKRYDEYIDTKSNEEYINWICDIFYNLDEKMKDSSVILFNISYTVRNPSLPFQLILEIEKRTNFNLKETIIWKKKTAMPLHTSPVYLTRLTEFVFVFSKNDLYHTNKKLQVGKNNQNYYTTFYNFIEADNNDGSNDLNKATFSTDLVLKLLNIYGKKNGLVYDCFAGIGTTLKAAEIYGMNSIGSEISKKQFEYYESK